MREVRWGSSPYVSLPLPHRGSLKMLMLGPKQLRPLFHICSSCIMASVLTCGWLSIWQDETNDYMHVRTWSITTEHICCRNYCAKEIVSNAGQDAAATHT